jgi:hypothetical protein
MANTKLMPPAQIIQIQQRQVNNVFQEYNDAALIIQNAWKKYKEKKEAAMDKKIELILLKEISAQIIQNWWRNLKNK